MSILYDVHTICQECSLLSESTWVHETSIPRAHAPEYLSTLHRAREKEGSNNFELETWTDIWLSRAPVRAKKWKREQWCIAYDNNNNDDGLDDLSDDNNADVHNSIEDIDDEKNDNEV